MGRSLKISNFEKLLLKNCTLILLYYWLLYVEIIWYLKEKI